MLRPNRHSRPLRGSSRSTGAGIHVKRETTIIMCENMAAGGQGHATAYEAGSSSSHPMAVMAGHQTTINHKTFHSACTIDSQVHHLRSPKTFRTLSNASSIISGIFRHPDTSEDVLRNKIQRANDRDASRTLMDFLRNKTPPPGNFMSDPGLLKGGDPPAKKKKGVLAYLGRKLAFRKGKKGEQTSSPSSSAQPPPLLQLPDTAISGRTTSGHRHIAISIPVEHAHVDGVVDDRKPPTEQPNPTPPTTHRKPLRYLDPPVVGERSSSRAATIRITPPPPDKPPPLLLDRPETVKVPTPAASPNNTRCLGSSDDSGELSAVCGRSLTTYPHELTAAPAAVSGAVVPLNKIPSHTRPLHRSPPLRHKYPALNARSEDTAGSIPGLLTSSTSSTGATTGPSLIPEQGADGTFGDCYRAGGSRGQQKTTAESQPPRVAAEKRPFRDWFETGESLTRNTVPRCWATGMSQDWPDDVHLFLPPPMHPAQLPTPPEDQDETPYELDADENDRFVTAQASFEHDPSPWIASYEESTALSFPPCDASTPKLRPMSLPSTRAPSPTPDSHVPRRMPRSQSHKELIEYCRLIQEQWAKERRILKNRLEAYEMLEGRGSPPRGYAPSLPLGQKRYKVPAAQTSALAVLHESDDDAKDKFPVYPPNLFSSREDSSYFQSNHYKYDGGASSASWDHSSSDDYPENLASDYVDSDWESFQTNPSEDEEDGKAAYCQTIGLLPTTANSSPTNARELADIDRPRGFPDPPLLFPAHDIMYSAPLPPPRPQDSFESFFEKIEAAKRKAAVEAASVVGVCDHKAEEDCGVEGVVEDAPHGVSGLETVEPVMRWLIQTSSAEDSVGSEGRDGEGASFDEVRGEEEGAPVDKVEEGVPVNKVEEGSRCWDGEEEEECEMF